MRKSSSLTAVHSHSTAVHMLLAFFFFFKAWCLWVSFGAILDSKNQRSWTLGTFSSSFALPSAPQTPLFQPGLLSYSTHPLHEPWRAPTHLQCTIFLYKSHLYFPNIFFHVSADYFILQLQQIFPVWKSNKLIRHSSKLTHLHRYSK